MAKKLTLAFIIFSAMTAFAGQREDVVKSFAGCYKALSIDNEAVDPASFPTLVRGTKTHNDYKDPSGMELDSLNVMLALEEGGTEYYRLLQIILEGARFVELQNGYKVQTARQLLDNQSNKNIWLFQTTYFDRNGDELLISTTMKKALTENFHQSVLLKQVDCD